MVLSWLYLTAGRIALNYTQKNRESVITIISVAVFSYPTRPTHPTRPTRPEFPEYPVIQHDCVTSSAAAHCADGPWSAASSAVAAASPSADLRRL